MWTLEKKEESVSLLKNGKFVGVVEFIQRSNNVNCVKVHLLDEHKILCLTKFDWRANPFANKFQKDLQSRTDFMDKWNELKGKDEVLCRSERSEGGTRKKVSTMNITSKEESRLTSTITTDESLCSRDRSAGLDESIPLQNSTSGIEPAPTASVSTGIEESFTDGIEKKFKGYFKLPVEKLVEPQHTKLVRKPDLGHVKELEKEFREKPHNYFTLMVVNLPGIKEVPKKINDLTFVMETIGGNHSPIALQNLLKDTTLNRKNYDKRLCAVYCDLNTEEAKRVGMEHNAIHRLGKELNYFSRVECFRGALFQTAGLTEKDDPTTKQTPVSKTDISRWKKALENITGAVNRKDLNNKYRFDMMLARLSTKSWLLVKDFVQTFENQGKGKKRAISGRQLRCLDGLTDEQISQVLDGFKENQVDLSSLKTKCDKIKGNTSSTKKKTEPNENNGTSESDDDTAKDEDILDTENTPSARDQEYKSEMEEKEKELVTAKKKIDSLTKQLSEIKNEVKSRNQQLNEKEIELKKYIDENLTLKSELDENKALLQERIKRYENKQIEMKQLTDDHHHLKSSLDDSKKKIANLYRENQKLSDDARKRKQETTLTELQEERLRDIDLNPSPTKQLRIENGKQSENVLPNEETQINQNPVKSSELEFKIQEKVMGFWKEDKTWYEAVVTEKRKTGYLVVFTLDQKKRVLKPDCLKRKKGKGKD